MCTNNRLRTVNKLLAREGLIEVYKVLERNWYTNKICSPVYSKVWHKGWNRSNAKKSVKVCRKDGQYLCRGIHVFLNKKDAFSYKHSRSTANTNDIYVVVKMYCRAIDLIGAGTFGSGRKVAVFKQAFTNLEETKSPRSSNKSWFRLYDVFREVKSST